MESKLMIDIDASGHPYIWVDFKPSDDLRDKVLNQFLTATGVWIRKKGENGLPLSLHIIDDKDGRTQAMIEPIPSAKREKAGFLIILGLGNVVRKDQLDDNDLADAESGHSCIIDLAKQETSYKGIRLPVEESI